MCSVMREQNLRSHGVSTQELELLLKAVSGLKVPEPWKKLDLNTEHIITSENYGDSKQLTRLIHALIGHFKTNGFPIQHSAVQVDSKNTDIQQLCSSDTEATSSECAVEKTVDPETKREADQITNAVQATDFARGKKDSPKRKREPPSRKIHTMETRADLLEKDKALIEGGSRLARREKRRKVKI